MSFLGPFYAFAPIIEPFTGSSARNEPPTPPKSYGGGRDWLPISSAPMDGTVIEAVGRYLDASAGFPRYVHCHEGAWYDCSRHVDEVIIWAWRPRTNWPHEPAALSSSQGRVE